jgi:hypothetical protein
MVTVVMAIAAGGAPIQVIEYVTWPALVSVTDIDPDSARMPLQPSPVAPPAAAQESAFCEARASEMLCPATCVAAFADRVTVGMGAAAVVEVTTVYVTEVCASLPLQYLRQWRLERAKHSRA